MRLPRRPPPYGQLIGESVGTANLSQIISSVRSPTVEGKYLHWDRLRFYPTPEPLSLREWWLGLKLKRMGQWQPIPLVDKGGEPFKFALVDPLPERLHKIDLTAGGTIRMPEIVTNPATKDQFLVRSLIEEAFTSSQLEGAGTTRERAKEMIRRGREPRDVGERMVLNNYRTMQRILTLGDEDLSPEVVFEIHRMVTEGTLDDPSAAGRLRRADEYRVVGDHLGEVVYHEPPERGLEARLSRMCDFANGEGSDGFVHPVIRSMILHFWLAYDHPFIDGNGRTARALFYWSMLRHGYWLFEFVSISNIILRGPAKYERAFLETETDDNDLTYFLLYHAHVIDRAIEEMHGYIRRKMTEVNAVASRLRGVEGLNHRQRSMIVDAVKHPGESITVESHRRTSGVVTQTARTDLTELVRRGLFVMEKVGRAVEFRPVPDLEERLKQPPTRPNQA